MGITQQVIFGSFLAGVVFAAPKNLLVIMSDDAAWDQSFYNTDPAATLPPTPNLENLAAQGTLLTGMRSMPVCTPSRVSFLTGRHQKRTGVFVNDGTTLNSSEYTYADDLKTRGYTTALFGKWGLGSADGNDTPRTRGGFDHFAGNTPLGLWPADYYAYNKTTNGGGGVATNEYLTTNTTNDAIAWISAQSGNWCASVWYHAPHWKAGVTFQWPPAELITTPNTGGNGVEAYRATIEAMDTEIGRLIAAVPSDTIIIYTSDNGSHFINPPNVNGTKGSEYDDAYKVPFIVKGPGLQAGKVVDQPFSFEDIYPTLLGLANGYTPASPNALDGRDISGVFRGEAVPERVVFSAKDETGPFAATDGDFRLIDYQDATPDLFFDLRSDPNETSALALGSLTGAALKAYNNLRYALTTYTAKTDEQAVVVVNYAQPSVTTGGIRVVSGNVTVSSPTVGSATITAPLKSGATDYTLWVRDNPFGAWLDSGITESVGVVVSFTDSAPIGRKEYRITNNAPEP
jgi:arylsulfatase A-like enzyme